MNRMPRVRSCVLVGLACLYGLSAAAGAWGSQPGRVVEVEVIERVPANKWTWSAVPRSNRERFELTALGFSRLPNKYTPTAVIADRAGPFLLRATLSVRLGEGPQVLLLRSLNGARLWVDGRVLAVTPFTKPDTEGHEAVTDLPPEPVPGARLLPMGHAEQRVEFESDGRVHHVVLEAYVGGPNLRQEIGELSVSRLAADNMFYLLAPEGREPVALTDAGWESFSRAQAAQVAAMNAERRRRDGAKEMEYWAWRHGEARSWVLSRPAPVVPQALSSEAVQNEVDRFVLHKLREAGVEPAALADDHAFLRRVYLDVVGVVPTPDEVEAFFAEAASDRRANVIDRLLADPRWADAWVGYWQDVLGENPGILKPEQNNTGPFRWWIYESFLDNKPFDRFATELVMMQGSVYYGGPAGFSLATQNDAPMAEKAHVVAQSFLGVEMKCARCHDAPFHDVDQRDLFGLAAMLNRKPQPVPATSSIPAAAQERKLSVSVTLIPGGDVEPRWPLEWMLRESDLPSGLVRNAGDSRDRLAALTTWAGNERFSQVAVNRLWQRYLGFGLVEPADDWEVANPSHPELLQYLARELVGSGYDLKHVARLILRSHTYQRAVVADKGRPLNSTTHLFASPMRRRLAAEQLADSLLCVAGMECDSEPLTFDPEGRRPVGYFLNLGRPTRAWQFTSLSNERDRPALAMPRAQSVTDLLMLFGWRESRSSPMTRRDDAPMAQQPAALANGLLSRRVVRLSDDNALTDWCIASEDLRSLVEGLFLRVLTRPPTDDERVAVEGLLRDGFERRVVHGSARAAADTYRPRAVSWANHLNPQATEIKKEMERYVQQGTAATMRLEADWRQRAEDVVWALVNSPEFVFVP